MINVGPRQNMSKMHFFHTKYFILYWKGGKETFHFGSNDLIHRKYKLTIRSHFKTIVVFDTCNQKRKILWELVKEHFNFFQGNSSGSNPGSFKSQPRRDEPGRRAGDHLRRLPRLPPAQGLPRYSGETYYLSHFSLILFSIFIQEKLNQAF